ncbi:hypothetical protein MTO96_002151 [Rhipicephalus appendiculatus]
MPVARALPRRGTVAFSGWVFDCAVVLELRILLAQSLYRPPSELLRFPVPSLPWTSAVFHHSPGQLSDMSTVVVVPKRRRRRKFKAKVPFFGPRISCPSTSPSSNTQANLPELFALLTTTQQEADQDERRCEFPPKRDRTIPSSRRLSLALLESAGTTSSDSIKARPSSGTSKTPERKGCVEGWSEVASAKGDVTHERLEPSAFTDSHVVLRKMRMLWLGNDASEERD